MPIDGSCDDWFLAVADLVECFRVGNMGLLLLLVVVVAFIISSDGVVRHVNDV